MTRDRIVAYHVDRLNNRQSSIRLDAIEQLQLLNAIDAMPDLENTYRNDPDETVRRRAKETGRYLYNLLLTKQKQSIHINE